MGKNKPKTHNIHVAMRVMVVYAFCQENYDFVEVGTYDEHTCEVLSKYDGEHVKKFEFQNNNPDNAWEVYMELLNTYDKIFLTRSFENVVNVK